MEQTLQHLNEAIEFVKSLAPEVWAVYLKQQIIHAWVTMTTLISLLLVSIPLHLSFKDGRPGTHEWDRETHRAVGWGVTLGVMLILALVVAIVVPNCIMVLMNPEYHAIKELLP